MIRRAVSIPRVGWRVDIFYDVHPCDADYIIEHLWQLGCPERHLDRAEHLLKSGVANEGLTYSNPYERKSLIVVGHADSPLTLVNTLLHEVDHLQVAICRADGLRLDGEDAAYLMGDITEAVARNAWHALRNLFLYLI